MVWCYGRVGWGGGGGVGWGEGVKEGCWGVEEGLIYYPKLFGCVRKSFGGILKGSWCRYLKKLTQL